MGFVTDGSIENPAFVIDEKVRREEEQQMAVMKGEKKGDEGDEMGKRKEQGKEYAKDKKATRDVEDEHGKGKMDETGKVNEGAEGKGEVGKEEREGERESKGNRGTGIPIRTKPSEGNKKKET